MPTRRARSDVGYCRVRRRQERYLCLGVGVLVLFLAPWEDAQQVTRSFVSKRRKRRQRRSQGKLLPNPIKGRQHRFPSVQERVRIYMSDFYLPPCDNRSGLIFYQFHGIPTLNVSRVSSFWSPYDSLPSEWNQSPLELEHLTVPLKLYVSNHPHQSLTPLSWPSMINNQTSISTIANICTNEDDAVCWADRLHMEQRAALSQYPRPYCQDILHYMPHLYLEPHLAWRSAEAASPNSTASSSHLRQQNQPTPTAPLLFRFGDQLELFPAPHFEKFRQAYTVEQLHAVTQQGGKASCQRRPVPLLPSQPILWRLTTERHLLPCDRVASADSYWDDKLPMAVWRGSMTGGRPPPDHVKNATDQEICQYNQRCRLVYELHGSSYVDAKLTRVRYLSNNTSLLDGVPLLGNRMSMAELLRYKIILSLQGNDLASGLKWNLLSRSVVLMPPPTLSSWVMEERLVPWVHYVPLDVPLSRTDVESKVQWVLDHDEAAQAIALAGSQWMQDLLYHPQAEKDNQLIQTEILQRYQAHFQPLFGNSQL